MHLVLCNKKNLGNIHFLGFWINVSEKIRTPDTLVRSQVLYPAELRTHILFLWSPTNAGDRNRTGTVLLRQDFKSCASASSATPAYSLNCESGTNRARTCDPLLVRQVLSQLSYDPRKVTCVTNDPSGTRTRDLRRDRAAL